MIEGLNAGLWISLCWVGVLFHDFGFLSLESIVTVSCQAPLVTFTGIRGIRGLKNGMK